MVQMVSHATRERMVNYPTLLLRALQDRQAAQSGEQLRNGPEGACASDVRRVEALLVRLRQRLSSLAPVPEVLIDAMPRLKAAVHALDNAITWAVTHDTNRDVFERACVEGAGPQPAGDQPSAQALGTMREPGAGLIASAVCAVLSEILPLRGQALSTGSSPLYGWYRPGLYYRQ
jgi:hypothetical protein